MSIMGPNTMPGYGGFTWSTNHKVVNIQCFNIFLKKKTHYGFVISGPSIKGVPFGKEAKGMEVPSGDNAALGQ